MWVSDGAFQGIIESVRDVTQRMRAEEALQQCAERLRDLNAQLAEVAEAERRRLLGELDDWISGQICGWLYILRTRGRKTLFSNSLTMTRPDMPTPPAPP